LAAEVMGRGLKKPGKDDLKFVNEGVLRFSRRPILLVRSAELNLRYGDPEDARNIINFGLKVVGNSPARLALASLRDELPPEPPAPAPVAAPANPPATPPADAKNAAPAKKP
jgi:hypothetical protein